MKSLRFNILMLLMVIVGCAWAQQASIEVSPPRAAIEGQKFNITVRLTNCGNTSAPQAPVISGCEFIYNGGQSTMHSAQYANGKMESSTTVDYTYIYKAGAAGEVTIPAITINAGGKRLTSNPVKFNILPPDQAQQQGANNRPGTQNRPQQGQQSDLKIDPNDMFVRVIVNKTSVYEQEALVATVKIYSKHDISSFRAVTQPTFEGFFSEELPVSQNVNYEHLNGQNYSTLDLRKLILYPQKTGNLTITSGKFEMTIVQMQTRRMGFFLDHVPVEIPYTTESNSVNVRVEPLPTPKPDGFNGAVGNFSATAEMTNTQLRTNEATSYIIKVKGTGNIKYLKAPQLNLPPGIDQFTPKTEIDANFTGGDMRGSYTVNYTLVPQEPGTYEIPARKFSYFNPADKKYHTIDLQGFQMQVAQGATTSSVTEQTSINKGQTDILHIKPVVSLSKRHSYTFHTVLYWALYGACAVTLLVIILAYRRNIKLNADVQGRKMARANKQATKRLKQAKAYMQRHESDKFYAELNQAMSGYLSDKLGIPASQLVRDNIASQLQQRGISQGDVDQIIHVLDECEMARFTPQHSDAEMSQLYKQAADAIDAVESNKK